MSTLVSIGGREIPLESLILSEEKTRLFDCTGFPGKTLEFKSGSWIPFNGVLGTIFDGSTPSISDLRRFGFIPNESK